MRAYAEKAMIDKESCVYQDFAAHIWDGSTEDVNTVFDVEPAPKGYYYWCRAFGFGVPGSSESYGSGRLYVRVEDLSFVEEECEHTTSTV